ncbi:MAG: CAP domain-containing protein [Verrucomicrobiales bacterium]
MSATSTRVFRKASVPWWAALGVWLGWVIPAAGAEGQTPAYDFGSPTAEEQMMIEYINRSRVFPAAEAQGYRDAADPAKRPPDQLDWNLKDAYSSFGVNMAVAVQRMSALPVVPAVAPNAKLMAVARQHTQWMFSTKTQSHTQPPATSPSDSIVRRVSAVGYNYAGLGENVYAYGRDLYYSHAGFEVDWGGPDNGMQSPPAHRLNNHSKDHREIGVGVHIGYSGFTASDVGPVVGTVDFGLQRSSPAFVTGVAYYDMNGNQRYDLNEGIGGLRVDVEGASHHAITAPGGGYVVPVPQTASTRAVTLSGLRAAGQASAVIDAGKNVKIDFRPAYVTPVLSGPGGGAAGAVWTSTFPTTPGATAYEVVASPVSPAALEPADGATQLDSYVTPGRYLLLQSSVRVGSSGAAIHLAHPVLEDQWVRLKPIYVPGAAGSVKFDSWLRASSVRQVARLQVSIDDGQSWTDAWTKVGTATGGSNWAPVTVSLANYAGRLVRLRFNYTLTGNTWLAGLGVNSGWFLDNISFTGVEQLTAPVTTTVPASGPQATWQHTPSSPGSLVVAARPVISGLSWEYGPSRRIEVAAMPPYLAWAAAEETRLGLPSGSLASNLEVPSGADGVAPLVRYALGLAADQSAAARLPQAQISPQGLCFIYSRDLSRADVLVHLEVSADYQLWHSAGTPGAPQVLSDTVLGVEGTLERRCALIAPTQGRVAARLRITPR